MKQAAWLRLNKKPITAESFIISASTGFESGGFAIAGRKTSRPLLMEPLSSNNADKTGFKQMLERHIAQLQQNVGLRKEHGEALSGKEPPKVVHHGSGLRPSSTKLAGILQTIFSLV